MCRARVRLASTIVLLVAVLLVVSGCSTIDKRLAASANASLSPEPLTTWARPVEITFELGDDIVGEAAYQVILGIFKTGEVPASAGGGLLSASTMLLGSITGKQAQDPQINTAAYKAAQSAEADGIYVTGVEIQEDSFLQIYKRREITVRGKALNIVNLGQVDEARADNARYIRLLPDGGVSLPEDSAGSWLPVPQQ
ncbi:MAG: hypothetical protein ACOC2D_03125 [Spirochaetota bacterium]